MRSLVRERIAAGEKPEAIRAWLVERYGNWVSYKPSAGPVTWPLWAAPALLVGIGLWLARGRFRRRGSAS
jgi:cytochrome c-type biogenesis protein CcmH